MAVMFGICVAAYCWGEANRKKLQVHHNFATARIEKWYRRTKPSGKVVEYLYFINGKTFTGNQTISALSGNCDMLLGKELPLAYFPNNPEVHKLLLFPEDFNEYNLVMPDSLKWVEKLKL